jgi:hypothetical protein
MPQGSILRLMFSAPAFISWSKDFWTTIEQYQTHDSTLGVHLADLPTRQLAPGESIHFTISQDGIRQDEGEYSVEIE